MSGVADSSYNRRGTLCNGFFAHALDRLSGEALSREIAGRSYPRPALRDDAFRAHHLGIEGVQSSVDVLGTDAPRVEVVPDEQVARAPLRQQLGAPSGDPFVVDRSGTHQPVDGFLPRLRRHVRSSKPVRQLLLGEVPVSKRPRSPAHRLVASQLSPQPPRALPIERDADIEARREHDLGRQSPPRLALQLDLDACPWPSAQGANSWRRPSP
jgi:hypothetical protein